MTTLKNMKAKIQELDTYPNQPVAHNTITIAHNFEPRQVIQLAVENGALHIIQKKSRAFNHELSIADSMMFKSNDFILDPLAYILEQRPSKLFRVDCTANTSKKDPLEKLERYIHELPGSKS